MLKFQKANACSLKTLLSNAQVQLDIFGQAPGLTVFKKEKFTTKIGALSSMIIFSFCILYLVIEFNDLISKQNPIVYQYDTQLIESSEIPLAIKNFTLAITISSLDTSPIKKLDEYYNIKVKNCQSKREFNATLNITQVKVECLEYPTEPCNENHMQTQFQKEYLNKMQPGSIQCIQSEALEKNPPKFQGIVQANSFFFLQIQITICKNTTTTQTCAPIEEIQKQMKSGYYSIHFTDNLLQMNEPLNPLHRLNMLQQTSFSIQSSRSIYQTFKRATVITDNGLITTNIESQEGLVSNQWREASENYNDNFIINHVMYLDEKQSTYSRHYIKVQAILGKIGGFWNVAVLVFKILITPIIVTLMNIELINKEFRFEINKKEEQIIDQINEDFTSKIKNEGSLMFSSELKMQNNQLPISISRLQRFPSVFFQNTQLKKFLANYKKQLKLNIFDLILLTFGFKKKIRQQLQYAKTKCQKKLDVSYLINKIYELDKLKYILLSEEQLNLFNCLPKPIIPSDLFDNAIENKLEVLEAQKQYKFMLEDEKPAQLKLELAYRSYLKIKNQRQKSEIDNQLIEYLDEQLIKIFDCISKTDSGLIKSQEEQNSETNRNIQNQLISNRLSNVPLEISQVNFN